MICSSTSTLVILKLYIIFKTDSADDACLAKSRVEHCVEEIDRWMISNKLKLNDDKTELIAFSCKFRPRPCLSNVQIGSECIEHCNTVRNLGVLGEHVSKLCKSSHYHLRNISKIRKYLDENSTETLVHAFVSSKLDYCNALLIGLPKYQIDRLQSVLNTAARIITFTCKYDHITPVLVRLYWLPVSYRIRFKVLLLTYKALNYLICLNIPVILDLSLNICLVFLNPELLPMAIEHFLYALLSYRMNCPFSCACRQIYKHLNQDWRQCFWKWPIFRWEFALLCCILLCQFLLLSSFFFFCSV